MKPYRTEYLARLQDLDGVLGYGITTEDAVDDLLKILSRGEHTDRKENYEIVLKD